MLRYLGFTVQGVGFMVFRGYGLGSREYGLGIGNEGAHLLDKHDPPEVWFRCVHLFQGSRSRGWGLRRGIWGLGCQVWGLGLGFRVFGLWFEVRG